MRTRKSFLCLILAALLLGGCEKEEVQETGYQIYYLDEKENKLEPQNYSPETDAAEDLLDSLMEKWMQDPEEELISAKPETVSVISYEIKKRCLFVDFNGSYAEMSSTEEILLRNSLVQTMLQIPDVRSVQITVEGEALTDEMGEAIGSMTAKSFVNSEEVGVDGFEKMDYPFYFADENGRLQEETRQIHFSSSSEKIQVVLRQLIAGTKKQDLYPVIRQDTEILSAKIEDGLCTVNFSEEFNQVVENVPADTSIYAVVNTLCELNGVTSVKINIAGDEECRYLDMIDLSKPLEKREDLIETEEESDQKVGVDYLMRKVTQEETESE